MATHSKAPDCGPYLLRGVGADRVSYGGFQYPTEGWVEAPDYTTVAVCGGGLHGLLNGLGDSGLVTRDGLGQVLCACEGVVEIDGAKAKCRRAYVLTFPCIQDAANWLRDRVGGAVHFATATSGYEGTSTSGYRGLISLLWWDGRTYRMRAAEVDGETIKAGVAYQLDADGHFVAVEGLVA